MMLLYSSNRLLTMALRGAFSRLLSTTQKCASITASRAQGTTAAVQKGELKLAQCNKGFDSYKASRHFNSRLK